MDLPIEIFLSFIAFSIVMGLVGIVKKIPMLLVIGGSLITFWAIMTDNIQMGFAEPLISDSTENIIYTLEYPMNVTVSDSSSALHSTGIHGMAERPANINSALYLEPISCITVDLSKTGSPTGTATIGILGGTNVMIKTFASLDVSTLSTTQRTYTFCLPNHDYWTISLYDRIGILYNGGSSGNQVNFYYRNADVFDSTNSVRATLSTAGTWTDASTTDVRMILSYDRALIESIPIYEESEPFVFPFTQWPKILFALIGSLFMIGGAVVWKAIEE